MEIGDEFKIDWSSINKIHRVKLLKIQYKCMHKFGYIKPCINKENKYIVQNISKSGISAYFKGNPVKFCNCDVCKDLRERSFSCMSINSLIITRCGLSIKIEDKINMILNK